MDLEMSTLAQTAACAAFGPGSLIELDMGFCPVERVCEGDLVQARSHGSFPVLAVEINTFWMGHVVRHPHHKPVRLRAGCLGGERPWRDLIVSPGHPVLLQGALAMRHFGEVEIAAPAAALLKLSGVEQVSASKITYCRLLFERPVEIRGEGVWCSAEARSAPMRLTG